MSLQNMDPRYSATIEARFWAKVHKTDTCWLWTGAITCGYGSIGRGRHEHGAETAHRVSYHLHKGPIAPGLEIDHLCRNRRCVNPAHLEAVTPRVNNLRGTSPAAYHARKTHCLRDHALAGDNLYVMAGGERRCRTCHALRERERVRPEVFHTEVLEVRRSLVAGMRADGWLIRDIAGAIGIGEHTVGRDLAFARRAGWLETGLARPRRIRRHTR